MKKSKFAFVFLLEFLVLFSASAQLEAADFSNGSILLVLNEKNGRFSLYSTGEGVQGGKQSLLADEDPRTTFLALLVNDRSYKMGDTSAFKIRFVNDDQNPSFIFESSMITVTEEFSFLTNRNSAGNNSAGSNSAGTGGIKITVTVQNRLDRSVTVGARYLLDTYLGEGQNGFPIVTNQRTINSETLLTRDGGDLFWTDRNRELSLTGSIDSPSSGGPDSIHIANWKRLSDASWKAVYQSGRNFNLPPYSVGDIGVCYYFDSRELKSGESWSFGFSLTAQRIDGSAPGQNAPTVASSTSPRAGSASGSASGSIAGISTGISAGNPAGSSAGTAALSPAAGTSQSASGQNSYATREQDLAELRKLLDRINGSLALGAASDDELAAIESALKKLQAKYGIDSAARQGP